MGRNLGAGMSGGLAYVLDRDRTLSDRINAEMVTIDTGLDVGFDLDAARGIARKLVNRRTLMLALQALYWVVKLARWLTRLFGDS